MTGTMVVLYTAILPSLAAQVLFIKGVEYIGANRAGLFINAVPIFGTLLAVALLGEDLRHLSCGRLGPGSWRNLDCRTQRTQACGIAKLAQHETGIIRIGFKLGLNVRPIDVSNPCLLPENRTIHSLQQVTSFCSRAVWHGLTTVGNDLTCRTAAARRPKQRYVMDIISVWVFRQSRRERCSEAGMLKLFQGA